MENLLRALGVDIAAVVDNCAVALQAAEEMAGFRPTQVVIGIAGELVKGFTTAHSQERARADVPITKLELQKLIEGVQREGLREAQRSITWETGLANVDVRLVHAAIGALVIAVITNGLGLLGLPAGINLLVTGGVLILAATVDALSRLRSGGGSRV